MQHCSAKWTSAIELKNNRSYHDDPLPNSPNAHAQSFVPQTRWPPKGLQTLLLTDPRIVRNPSVDPKLHICMRWLKAMRLHRFCARGHKKPYDYCADVLGDKKKHYVYCAFVLGDKKNNTFAVIFALGDKTRTRLFSGTGSPSSP